MGYPRSTVLAPGEEVAVTTTLEVCIFEDTTFTIETKETLYAITVVMT